jgi:hypothetical protein
MENSLKACQEKIQSLGGKVRDTDSDQLTRTKTAYHFAFAFATMMSKITVRDPALQVTAVEMIIASAHHMDQAINKK